MKRFLCCSILVSLMLTAQVKAQAVDCGQLLTDYQTYKDNNQITEMSAALQSGLDNNCGGVEYQVAQNHRVNGNFEKYVEYLNLAANHGEKAAKCDLLMLFESGTIKQIPSITKEECSARVKVEGSVAKADDGAEPLEYQQPNWTREERRRIWQENYDSSFTSFNDPFDYSKVDFDRIDRAWTNQKVGLGLMFSGLGVSLIGSLTTYFFMYSKPGLYSGISLVGLGAAMVVVGAPFVASNNLLLRQGGVKFRTDGIVVTYNGVGVAYSRRFPHRPGYELRRSHYVKIKKEGPHAMLTPTFSKDYKGLSLVAVW